MADRPDFTFNPREYIASERLCDGSSLRIRAIRPNDKQRLLSHFENLSQQARYFRFFGHKRSLTNADLRQLTELDFVRHVGLVAMIAAPGGQEAFIGVGRYVRDNDERAEIALAVLDDHQRKGVGSILIKHLVRIAQQAGIGEFVADVMGSNQRVLEFVQHRGCVVRHSNEAGIVHFTLHCGEVFSNAKRELT
jgi:GNAT superfamily N-acetyltransferase